MGRKRRACTQAIRTAKNPFLGCFFCVFCETLASSAFGCSARLSGCFKPATACAACNS